MEPEICAKMPRNFSEKLRAKFPAITRGYSMAKIARLDDALSDVFDLEASPEEGQSLLQKYKKRRKRKGKKKKIEKVRKVLRPRSLSRPSKTQNFDFCARPIITDITVRKKRMANVCGAKDDRSGKQSTFLL